MIIDRVVTPALSDLRPAVRMVRTTLPHLGVEGCRVTGSAP